MSITRLAANLKFNWNSAVDFKIEQLASPPTFDSNKRGHVLVDSNGFLRLNNGSTYAIIRDHTQPLVDGDIAPTAAIQLSKLAVDPLNRANHTGTQTAASISNFDAAAVSANASAIANQSTFDRARANHTGTQAASTISDLSSTVKAYRWDEFAAPTADVSAGNRKITNLASPTTATDAATKGYVDTAIAGFHQMSTRAATTANISLTGLQTIDGVTLVAGDRVLVKNQTSTGTNGIYVAATGAWARAGDMDTAAKVDGTLVVIEDGASAGTLWLTTSEVTALGTDPIVFTQFSSAADLTAGAGLSKSGNSISVANLGISTAMLQLLSVTDTILASSAVTNAKIANLAVDGSKLAVGAVDLASNKVTGTLPLGGGGTGATTAAGARTNLGAVGMYSNGATHGSGNSIVITAATHGLGAGRNKQVTLVQESTGDVYAADVNIASNGDVTVGFGASQSANTWRVVIQGF